MSTCFLRCLLFLVTIGNLTLLFTTCFHEMFEQAKQDIAIFSYKWYLNTFVFHMGVNSIRAEQVMASYYHDIK